MKRQERQHAQLLIPDSRVQTIRSLTMRDFDVPDSHRTEFKQACVEAAHCFKSPEEAERELQTLEANLLEPASSPESSEETGQSRWTS